MKANLVALFVLCLVPRLVAAEPTVPSLGSGAYILTLVLPSIPANEKTKDLVGTLKVSGDAIAFDTKASDGKPVAFSGKISESKILLWLTSDERDSIVSFHLSGSLTAENQAQGSVSIFQTHERVAQGTWTLKEK